jgi:hypothetical protein
MSTMVRSSTSPDFYWKYRLDRLIRKKGDELAFNEANYPESRDFESQYNAYYLDLVLQGKADDLDVNAEKKISDGEWFSIYSSICEWTKQQASKQKSVTASLASNDFDLLKQFYPNLDFKDLEEKFEPNEFGANFPYSDMKAMLVDAIDGKLNIPGYPAPSTQTLEASETKKALAELKEKTMAKLDKVYEEAMKVAEQPFVDDKARQHYKNLRQKLAEFPQSPAAWASQRADFERDLDEMARFASRKVEEHHHHEEGEGEHLSPAQEFEKKYGMNLEELQGTFNRFKSDPDAFLESSIFEKFGKEGLEIWKQSQEFAEAYKKLSPEERAVEEASYMAFLKQA